MKGGFQDLSGALASWARGLPAPRRIEALWTLACGDEIRSRTRLVGLEGRWLVVELRDAAWREAVESLAPRIAARMNELAGRSAVAGIRLREARA